MKIGISTIQTTSGVNSWSLVRRSSLNTGGTSSLRTCVPYNSQNGGSGVSVSQYTANPVLGNSVGVLSKVFVASPSASSIASTGTFVGTDVGGVLAGTFAQTSTPTSVGSAICELCFLDQFGQPLTLRNENECISWNFEGVALPAGLAVSAYVVWYEQTNNIFQT
jgi:hypothetical protein